MSDDGPIDYYAKSKSERKRLGVPYGPKELPTEKKYITHVVDDSTEGPFWKTSNELTEETKRVFVVETVDELQKNSCQNHSSQHTPIPSTTIINPRTLTPPPKSRLS